MTDDRLDVLRAAVGRHTGTARGRPLLELGAGLADRYWRVGPGSPAGRPVLDETIQVMSEAYGYFEEGGFLRGQVAAQLGWLLGIRHGAHGGPTPDAERGIVLLEEALTFPQQPPMAQAIARLALGQLLLSGLLRAMQAGDFAVRLMGSGLSAQERAAADRAVVCARGVLDDPTSNAAITSAAETLLTLAEAVQTLGGGLGGPGGLDLGRMMQALGALQNLQQQASSRPAGVGFGRMPTVFDFDADGLAATDPLDRPVMVVDGTVVDPPTRPRPRPPAAPRVPAATLRADMLRRLPGSGLADVSALLIGAATALDIDTVDDLVALGSALVAAPGAVGTDHLLLAVALHLRDRIDDGGGWGGAGGGEGDAVAAADSLLAATEALTAEPADTVAVAFRLATLLDERLPAGDVRARFGAGFIAVTGALRAAGADALAYLHAGDVLLLSATTGRFSHAATGSPLPARILVAGEGAIADGPTVSHVASGAQVVELAGRTRLPLTASPVFVANPRGDRDQATFDAMALRRSFYPRSTGLGRTAENCHGAATPDEVRAGLDASMLHLGCGVTADGGLELAGSAVLTRADIVAARPAAGGGLAVLPPTATGAAELTEALIAAGYVDVIGFRDPVPGPVASLMYVLLHAQLVDRGRDPAGAVGAVRGWMADPHRSPPVYLPPACAAVAEDPDPVHRDALIHHGV